MYEPDVDEIVFGREARQGVEPEREFTVEVTWAVSVAVTVRARDEAEAAMIARDIDRVPLPDDPDAREWFHQSFDFVEVIGDPRVM